MRIRFSEIFRYLINIFLVGWMGFTIFIFLWIIMTSFKSTRGIYMGVWKLPSTWHVDNYVRVLEGTAGLARFMANSLGVISAATLLVIMLSTPLAYVLSKIEFPGSSSISMFFIIGLGIPVQSIFIPLYLIMNRIQLTDSLIGLTWLYAVLSLPFTVYILMGFFKTIPSSIEDSARIDGASAWQSFRTIMIPLARSGIVSVAIYNFVMLWKEFLLALVFISGETKQTISLGLYSMVTKMTYTGDWGGLFAGVVLVVMPSVIFYIIFARQFVRGITMGIGKA